jgi:hypothetical protein
VKLTPLLATPDTVTTTLPVVAAEGTVALSTVLLQVAVAVTPLNVTVLLPWLKPKLLPLIVTEVPAFPEVGDTLVITGVGRTVKLLPLLSIPATCTTTFPVVAPAGTSALMVVEVQLDALAGMPLNFTVLLPGLDPKFVPVTVTDAPTAPDVGDRLLMLGATVNNTPLLATPDTVTTTFPVKAPVGTFVMMMPELQLVMVAVVPLNLTVLLP